MGAIDELTTTSTHNMLFRWCL